MKVIIINKIIILLYAIIIVSVFITVYYFIINLKMAKKDNFNAIKGFNKFLMKNTSNYFSYDRIALYLKKNGNPLGVSPAGYLISKCIVAFMFFIITSANIIFSIIATVIGYCALDLIISISNKNDMKNIRLELADVYDFLSIQTSAGVFIGAALTESYLLVGNKRLKKALAELCAEINLTKDINNALDKFGESFNSVEIDCFILIIKQSLVSGKIEQALDDLSVAQKDANFVLLQEQNDRIQSSKGIIEVMMYIGIIAVIMYGLFIELVNEWSTVF